MKKRLVIDDVRTFPRLEGETFTWPAFEQMETTYARTNAEAKELLQTETFEEVWFDHDMGGKDTTMEIVNWLEALIHDDEKIEIPRVYVHSANPVGKENIYRALSWYYTTIQIGSKVLNHLLGNTNEDS